MKELASLTLLQRAQNTINLTMICPKLKISSLVRWALLRYTSSSHSCKLGLVYWSYYLLWSRPPLALSTRCQMEVDLRRAQRAVVSLLFYIVTVFRFGTILPTMHPMLHKSTR
ncbi:hypothetical protein I7I48_00464 [Histoplasma ohiense]|nr:hypothetical protein I7I48_00464 [Histoplasma ohiense (nom. inval.)]